MQPGQLTPLFGQASDKLIRGGNVRHSVAMVFTHIPANVLLIVQMLVPTSGLAVGIHLVRSLMSQLDRPTRASYTMAVVEPDERSAAQGVIGFARSGASILSPSITRQFLGNPALISVPLILAGGLKITYDLLRLKVFGDVGPPEEQQT